MPEEPTTGSPAEEEAVLLRWCDETWPWLYRFVYARVQNREEAEDLTQETFLRVLRGRRTAGDPFPAPFPPPAQFMRTVALNLIRDRWRRGRGDGATMPLEESILLTESKDDAVVDRLWLQDLLDRLPPVYKEVLQWRIVAGCSREETARRMNRSEAAIRGLQYRALRALRDLMREVGGR